MTVLDAPPAADTDTLLTCTGGTLSWTGDAVVWRPDGRRPHTIRLSVIITAGWDPATTEVAITFVAPSAVSTEPEMHVFTVPAVDGAEWAALVEDSACCFGWQEAPDGVGRARRVGGLWLPGRVWP